MRTGVGIGIHRVELEGVFPNSSEVASYDEI